MQTEDVFRAFRLDGRAAAVTGGASGIGRATAEVLAGAGAGVVIGDVDESGAEKAARAIAEAGGKAVAQRVDVTSKADVESLVDRADRLRRETANAQRQYSSSMLRWGSPERAGHRPLLHPPEEAALQDDVRLR